MLRILFVIPELARRRLLPLGIGDASHVPAPMIGQSVPSVTLRHRLANRGPGDSPPPAVAR